jgi:hypothetical protein
MLTGLGTVLVLGTVTETAIASSYREGMQAFHAAEAAAEFAVRDLAAASDWEAVLTGEATSTFVDGPPGGTRLVGAETIDLTDATSEINAVAAAAAEDPPSYGLYAYGRFADLLQIGPVPSPMYVAVWIADLSSEEAGDPASRVVGIVGRAYGPTGSRRSIAVSVTRTGEGEAEVPASIHMLSWAELR